MESEFSEKEKYLEEDHSEIVVDYDSTTETALKIFTFNITSKMMEKISCDCCCVLLFQDYSQKLPSQLIIDVARYCENYIRRGMKAHGERSFAASMKVSDLINVTLYKFKDYSFEHDILHLIENVDHFTNLLTIFISLFSSSRIRHEFEKINDVISERSKLHSLVHFKNM